MLCCYYCFFFSSRRRHTRYWRDWSSDVCSSDLWMSRAAKKARATSSRTSMWVAEWRSEERRVGKECRSRWSPHHEKKKNTPTRRPETRTTLPKSSNDTDQERDSASKKAIPESAS